MNHKIPLLVRLSSHSPIALAAVFVACGAVAGCSGGDFSGEDGGLRPLPDVDASTAPPAPSPSSTSTGDASAGSPDAPPTGTGDAAPGPDGATSDADAARDAASDVETPPPVDAGDDSASSGDDAGIDAPPPPVDAATDAPVVCAPGYADCDGDPGQDCETNLASDPKHCGSCGHDCTGLPHVRGAVSCGGGGTCVVPASSCQPGYGHCSSNPDDGCETDLSQPSSCGGCGIVCSGGTPFCSPNGSGGYACSSGCPSSAPTRCGNTCVDTTSDPGHCGSCTTACSAPVDAVATCGLQNGHATCGFSCDATYHACGATCASNTSTQSCGSSCTPCTPPSNATATCNGTSCGFACNSGFHDCGGACDSNSSIQSCGSSCTPCTPPANATATCNGTSCGFTCDSGFHDCGGACDSNSSIQSCGSSCTPCTPPANATATCNGTSCGFTCDSGFHDCNGACDSNTSIQSCGSSCTPCTPPPNATATCDGTSCGFQCDTGYSKCPATGTPTACYDLSNDKLNCGACGHTCEVPDGRGNMVAGQCSAGACEAVPVASVSFTGTADTAPIINDAGRIVFVGGQTIYGMWNSGSYPAALASMPPTTVVVGGLAADASNYYFTMDGTDGSSNLGGVMSVPKTGGTPVNHYTSSSPQWFGLAIGGSTLYATDYINFADSFPLPQGTPVPAKPCASTPACYANVFGVAADANGAFFGASGDVFGNGAITSWAPGISIPTKLPVGRIGAQGALQAPFDIALDSTNVYWVAEDAGASTAGTLMQASRTNGAAITLATNQGAILKLAVANGYVYFTTAPATGVAGSVKRARVGAAGSVETLATDRSPWGIVVEGSYLYWTSLIPSGGGLSVVGLAL